MRRGIDGARKQTSADYRQAVPTRWAGSRQCFLQSHLASLRPESPYSYPKGARGNWMGKPLRTGAGNWCQKLIEPIARLQLVCGDVTPLVVGPISMLQDDDHRSSLHSWLCQIQAMHLTLTRPSTGASFAHTWNRPPWATPSRVATALVTPPASDLMTPLFDDPFVR